MPHISRAAAVPLLLTVLTALSAGCAGPAETISIGQSIHHDDFEYSVRRVEKLDRIGALAPAGVFYVVTFQVENRAKRVGHEWDNAIAYLVDERGREYENSTDAQKRLDALQSFSYRDHYRTSAGNTETTKLVFDLPLTAASPVLRVRGETLMGDVFDANRFKRTQVKLY